MTEQTKTPIEISEWFAIHYPTASTRLNGVLINDHPKFPAGRRVTTGPIVKIDKENNLIYTFSGTVYTLGKQMVMNDYGDEINQVDFWENVKLYVPKQKV